MISELDQRKIKLKDCGVRDNFNTILIEITRVNNQIADSKAKIVSCNLQINELLNGKEVKPKVKEIVDSF